MKEQSAIDVKYMLDELSFMQNAKLDQFYQIDAKEYVLRFYTKDGKRLVRFVLPHAFFEVEQKAEDSMQTPFSTQIRKTLKGLFIQKVEQPGCNRVLHFTFAHDYHLFVELFDRGNMILTDGEHTILAAASFKQYKNREIKKGSIYDVEHIPFPTQLKDEKTLAREGLGGLYAREATARQDIEQIYNQKLDPQEYSFGITPFILKQTDEKPKALASFSQGYAKQVVQPVEKKKNTKHEKIVEKQTAMKAQVEKSIEEYTRAGEYLYNNFEKIQEILDAAKKGKSHLAIVSLDPKTKKVTIQL